MYSFISHFCYIFYVYFDIDFIFSMSYFPKEYLNPGYIFLKMSPAVVYYFKLFKKGRMVSSYINFGVISSIIVKFIISDQT